MILKDQSQTITYGKKLSQSLKGGDVLCLYGELGAGKTTLVKGIALGLGIKEDITSPTFTLMNVYKVNNIRSKIKNLIHIDTYRLKNEQELVEIGVEDYLGKADTICIVEWPEKIENLLIGKNIKKIIIKHLNDNQREIIN